LLAIGATVGLLSIAGCSSTGDESGGSKAPVDTSVDDSPSSNVTGPPSSTRATEQPRSSLLAVEGPVVAGQQFTVSFSGRLEESRGGYLWVRDPDGATLALLRGDGNPEIPIGYELGPQSTMLDDGLSGEQSNFIFPSEMETGEYTLCTANSGVEECLAIAVLAG
jgi:hypothetical protein